MKKCGKISRFLFISLLISLVGFLVLPKICLADIFEEIALEQPGKYVELPDRQVEELLRSLISSFHLKWINSESSTYADAEEGVVSIIMREAIRAQVLNYFLIDAPIEASVKIMKTAIEIIRLFAAQDASVAIEKFEKESVKKAVEYGTSVLLQDETKVASGAIELNHPLQKGGQGQFIFQLIVI